MKSKKIKRKLKRICKKLVIQGNNHENNIIEYYRVMWKAARREFNEDNGHTVEAFMRECHEKSMRRVIRPSTKYATEYPEEKDIIVR